MSEAVCVWGGVGGCDPAMMYLYSSQQIFLISLKPVVIIKDEHVKQAALFSNDGGSNPNYERHIR